MEINLPERGIFRGMGKLELNSNRNKKHFPKLTNIHQSEMSHNHSCSYETISSLAYKGISSDFKAAKMGIKHRNFSEVRLGGKVEVPMQTESQYVFVERPFVRPPQPIIHKEEGVGIDEYEQRSGEKVEHCTTNKIFHRALEVQNTRPQYPKLKYDPITGLTKPNFPQKAFKLPILHEKYNILNGRKFSCS